MKSHNISLGLICVKKGMFDITTATNESQNHESKNKF